jgi:hypothetical protein
LPGNVRPSRTRPRRHRVEVLPGRLHSGGFAPRKRQQKTVSWIKATKDSPLGSTRILRGGMPRNGTCSNSFPRGLKTLIPALSGA